MGIVLYVQYKYCNFVTKAFYSGIDLNSDLFVSAIYGLFPQMDQNVIFESESTFNVNTFLLEIINVERTNRQRLHLLLKVYPLLLPDGRDSEELIAVYD